MDTTAVLIGVASALALGWSVSEGRSYVTWVRRGRRKPGPSRWRLRLAAYAALAFVGAMLGVVIASLQLNR